MFDAKEVGKDKRGHLLHVRPKQKLAVDLLLSGRATTPTQAVRMARYKETVVRNAETHVMRSKGVALYLKNLDDACRKKYGMSLQDKTMNVYYEALDSTKLFGKEAIDHPDHPTILQAADRMAKFFGWEKGDIDDDSKQYNQFNFFNVKPEQQAKFQDNLKNLIKKSGKS